MNTATQLDGLNKRNGLARLGLRVKQDLVNLCYPGKDWVPQPEGRLPKDYSDVVIIGAGMCGLAAYFALRRGGMRNIRILDRSPRGVEGPWLKYARMETLRSPKHLLGPASGLSSLTFQAWYRAQYGASAWDELDKIPREMWMDYLSWYRQVLDIPVESETSVDEIIPEESGLRLLLSGDGATSESFQTRRVVLATGREGLAFPNIPEFIKNTSKHMWAHSAEDIDFLALKGKRVAVVGIGASAVDNAAEALEAGAAEVRHLIRRTDMPRINKMMGIGSFGFTAGFPALSEAWRWRLMHYASNEQTPAPRGSTLRVSRHENAFFHFDAGVSSIQQSGSALQITTTCDATLTTDFIILGTGFIVEPIAEPSMRKFSNDIRLWRDIYTPPSGMENEELGKFPDLRRDFSFQERTPGAAPWLERIHCFNYGATMSLGKVSGDIPAVSEGSSWLAREIAAGFYAEDIETHWRDLQDYTTPELQGDEWTASDIPKDLG
jgi:FAD-dependent urate hydroxylase